MLKLILVEFKRNLITDEITLNSNHAVTLIVLGLGMNKKTSISDMQVFKKSVNTASAGDNVGINIKSIPAEAIKKGMLLVKGDCFKPTNHFEGTTYFLSKVCILPIHLKLPSALNLNPSIVLYHIRSRYDILFHLL